MAYMRVTREKGKVKCQNAEKEDTEGHLSQVCQPKLSISAAMVPCNVLISRQCIAETGRYTKKDECNHCDHTLSYNLPICGHIVPQVGHRRKDSRHCRSRHTNAFNRLGDSCAVQTLIPDVCTFKCASILSDQLTVSETALNLKFSVYFLHPESQKLADFWYSRSVKQLQRRITHKEN